MKKTVNHNTGTVRETVTNPITGTRHTRTRKKMTFREGLKGFLICVLAIALVGACGNMTRKKDAAPAQEKTATVSTAPETTAAPTEAKPTELDLVVNPSSGKIHRKNCSTIKNSAGLDEYHCTVDELEAKGYTLCGKCFG